MSTDCRLDKSLTNGGATKEKDADDFQEMLLREKAKAQSNEESVFVQKRGQADASGIHTYVCIQFLSGVNKKLRGLIASGERGDTEGPYFSQ